MSTSSRVQKAQSWQSQLAQWCLFGTHQLEHTLKKSVLSWQRIERCQSGISQQKSHAWQWASRQWPMLHQLKQSPSMRVCSAGSVSALRCFMAKIREGRKSRRKQPLRPSENPAKSLSRQCGSCRLP
eukprot:6199851-Pleurochrysis_carterae.AAC.2